MICSGKLTSRPAKHRDARPSPSQAGPQGAGRGKRRLPADGRTLVSPPHKSARGALGGASVACRGRQTLVPPYPRRADARRGATLLVTLGILTVLSVMAVTFLVTTASSNRPPPPQPPSGGTQPS